MQHRTLLALVGLSLAALPAPTTTPVPGPGGVIDAVQTFLTAIDARDAETLAVLVDDQGDNLHDYAVAGESTAAASKATAAFFEADAQGRGWQAGDKASFVAALTSGTEGTSTRVLSVRANCLSERCSYAMVEFERTIGAGEKAIAIPMRATALLRYAPSKDGEGKTAGKAMPSFKIYHWHASRGAPAHKQ